MATKFKSYRHESRADWGATLEVDQSPDRDQIKLGALLRIADSLEKIEKPFKQLLADVEFYRNSTRALQARNETLSKRCAAYRGIITKLKKEKA